MTAALVVDLALALLLVGAAVWAQRLVADLRTLPPADVPDGRHGPGVGVGGGPGA